jgi:hypothetical protein
MLPIITDFNKITLAPCKDSLYDIINKNGLTFYKSQVSIHKLESFVSYFNQKQNEVIKFMNENHINQEVKYEHITLWNNSEYIKNYIIKSFEDKKENDEEYDIKEYDINTYETDEYAFYEDEFYEDEVYEDEVEEYEFYEDEIEELKGDDTFYEL